MRASSKSNVLKYFLLVAILVGGCDSDLYTKHLASEHLERGTSVSVVDGYVDLHYTRNDSAAFSMFKSVDGDVRRGMLIAAQSSLSLVLIGLMIAWRRRRFVELMPYALILAGALGNLVDRIRTGEVVDFLLLHVGDRFAWPIFNLADVWIVVGGALVFIQAFAAARRPEEPQPVPE